MESTMDKWTQEQVIDFVKTLKDPLTPADVDKVIDKVKEHDLDGKEMQRCMSVVVCQDLLGLPIVKAGKVARQVRKHLPSGPVPKKQPEGQDTKPSFQRKEDLFKEPEHAFKVDEAQPADLQSADLGKVQFVHWSAGGLGSTGVFFLQLDSGWIVAKPTGTDTAGEVFATLLAKELGIRCPEYRIEAPEYQGGILRAMRFSNGKQEHLQRLRNDRIQGMVFMELVKGYPLPACAMKVLAESSGPNLLRHMGEMVVLDMVTNNFDRLPFIWTNFGNVENIMVQGNVKEDDGGLTIACIDQGTTYITNEKGRESYMDRVREGTKVACVSRDISDKHFKRLRDAILNGSGHDVGEEGCRLLMEGIQAGCARLARLMDEKPTILSDLASKAHERLMGIAELQEGTLDFVHDAASIVCEIYKASGLDL